MLFHPTRICRGGPSSREWLARQFNDPYVKKRLSHPGSFRSRSAFKLLEIDSSSDNFLTKKDAHAIVDLGAAPGGWSQVVAAKVGFLQPENKLHVRRGPWSGLKSTSDTTGARTFDPLNIDDVIAEETNSPAQPEKKDGKPTIIAVDLLRMKPIPGVHSIMGDFLDPRTSVLIRGVLEANGRSDGKVDVILSDMAANASGNQTADVQSSLRICEAVFEFATNHLRTAQEIGRNRGGVVLMKYFAHPELERFRLEKLVPNFTFVKNIKPPASRPDSTENYFLCKGWKPRRERATNKKGFLNPEIITL